MCDEINVPIALIEDGIQYFSLIASCDEPMGQPNYHCFGLHCFSHSGTPLILISTPVWISMISSDASSIGLFGPRNIMDTPPIIRAPINTKITVGIRVLLFF